MSHAIGDHDCDRIDKLTTAIELLRRQVAEAVSTASGLPVGVLDLRGLLSAMSTMSGDVPGEIEEALTALKLLSEGHRLPSTYPDGWPVPRTPSPRDVLFLSSMEAGGSLPEGRPYWRSCINY